MPKSRIATMASGCAEATASEPMLVILEKQLMRTFELAWHVEQARTRSNGELSEKVRSLFAGMAIETHDPMRLQPWSGAGPGQMGPISVGRLYYNVGG